MLFASIGGPGHLNPLIPIARAAQDAEHTVMWATSATLRALVEKAGFAFTQLEPASTRTFERRPLMMLDAAGSEEEVRENFARRATTRRLPLVSQVIEDWRPDLLVCDEFDFASMLAAEQAQVPHITVIVTATQGLLRPEVVAEPLDAIRAEMGLPGDPELGMLSRYLRLYTFPPSMRSPVRPVSPIEHAICPAIPENSIDTRPAWTEVIPDAPAVYFTLGTEFGLESGDLFERVLTGLASARVNLLMTVGEHIDPAEFGPQPAHVRIERYVPHEQVLQHCDIVVTHGGSGSVLGAIAHGLPSILLPLGADQPLNANRCTEIGAARALDASSVTPDEVRHAVLAVLADPSYRTAAESLRDELLRLPGPKNALTLLENVVIHRL